MKHWYTLFFIVLITLGGVVCSMPSYAVTMLCLGDSLTEGYGVAKNEAWPALVETAISKSSQKNKEEFLLINAGVSGSTSASGPSRLNWQIKSKQKIDWLFIELGANDGLRGQDVDAMKQNLMKVIKIAKDAKIAKIFLADMKVPTNYGGAYTKKFQESFAQIAKEQNIILVPFLLNGVAGKPELNLPDGIHPNKEGHLIVAKNLEKFFSEQLLRK